MPHVLHLVKDPTNAAALDVIRTQAVEPGMRLSVVLMHDAVRLTDELPGFADDPKASTEGKLEAIQMAWLEEFRANQ